MKYLLSPAGMKTLGAFTTERTLFAFDYDGTLAPIVENLLAAQIPTSTRELMGQLTERAAVALISGRSVSDLYSKTKFKPRPRFLIGNHGMQGLPSLEKRADHYKKICAQWKAQLAPVVQFLGPGLILEDKKFSLSLHYRESPRKMAVRRHLIATIEMLNPRPRVVSGKLLFNLLPEGAPNKGVALQYLMRNYRFERALYIGDDETDEDVFRLTETSLVTVRIGKTRTSSGQFYLRRQSEIDRFLRILLQKFKDHS